MLRLTRRDFAKHEAGVFASLRRVADRPDDNQTVRNYIIERRQPDSNEMHWMIYQVAYETKATLRNQQTGVCIEYRIRAANNAGTGPFSNTVSVVL